LSDTQLTKIATQLQQAFDPTVLRRLGREHGFMQRARTVTPERLALALVAALGAQPRETLADLHRSFNALHGGTVTYKPFYAQLAKETFPAFMQAVVEHLLQQLALEVLTPAPDSPLAAFTDLVLQDSSGLKVHDALREQFTGRYPVKAPAVAELHVTLSLRRQFPTHLSLTGQRADPRAALPQPTTLAHRLLIADRGYQGAAYCGEVDAAGGFFLIRCKQKLNPRIRRCFLAGKPAPQWEGKLFSELRPHLWGQEADLDVEFPKARQRPTVVHLRLVLLWNPHTQKHIYLATNLDRATFPAAAVGQLYRLRWQIELLFKEWKSYGNLHRFGTADPHIVEGLIWAALAAALLQRFLAHATQEVYPGTAISTRRAVMSLGCYLPRLAESLRGPSPALPRAAVPRAAARAARDALRTVRNVLRDVLAFLRTQATRSNPPRERRKGRLALGLQPIFT
jgi:hypothetical protein